MQTPITTIYSRPNWNGGPSWTYAGTALPSATGSAAVTAVAFDLASGLGQQLARGQLQYSQDGGKNWSAYAVPLDAPGAYVAAAGTLWRFLDRSTDTATPDRFGVHFRLADGSVASAEQSVIVDNPPAGIAAAQGSLFSTLQAGAVADRLAAIDTGAATGGRWLIDGQSQPGLFAIVHDPARDAGARLVIADPALLPASGLAAAVTVHYYDAYQLDAGGQPIAGQGVARTLVYTVEDGAGREPAGAGNALRLGAAADAWGAAPALASLADGGFVAVWQGADTVAGPTGTIGAGLWAQVRDAGGAARGAAFALTPDGNAGLEGAPAVAALAGGRWLVAYAVAEAGGTRIACRLVEADGRAGAERLLDAGASQDAAMPAIATLADGGVAVGWRSGGMVQVQQLDADGQPSAARQAYGALHSAFSPAIAPLREGGYLVTWGEIGDGNVYAATSAGQQAFVVSGDGYAASLATAAPLPHAATLANGNVVIAWDSYVNAPFGFAQSDVFFQIVDGGGHALGRPVQANLDGGAGRYDAAVGALADGGFVLAWQAASNDHEGAAIVGRRFGADGGALDAREFTLNQLRAGDHAVPDLVALAHGGFAAAWSNRQDGEVAVEARVFAGAGAGSGTAARPAPASVVGTAGIDTAVFAHQRGSYLLSGEGGRHLLLDAASGASTELAGVERLQFSDQTIALDIQGNAGQSYRLYQAAFDRVPDQVGLGYWIDARDHGHSLMEVAASFIDSAEFRQLYGAHPSDAQYVYALYQNVLHRAPDAGGYAFWLQALQVAPRAEVLVDFSESPENQAQVIGAIADGIAFTPWLG